MRRQTYSIRKGFEFQDLYCACVLLSLIEEGEYSASFQIECEAVHFIDDLVVQNGSVFRAFQIKFHTTHASLDSFQSLMATPRGSAKSLLQKLFSGWSDLSSDGDHPVNVEFVSSGNPDHGSASLGAAIDSATRRFGPHFFNDKVFAEIRKSLQAHLGTDESTLAKFLDSVTWRLGADSIQDLKTRLSKSLRHLSLPYSSDAIACICDLIGQIATEAGDLLRISQFIARIGAIPLFRDGCERQFPTYLPSASGTARVSQVQVGIVSLDALPAFASARSAPIEEPLPLGDYQHALSSQHYVGMFDSLRAHFYGQYMDWHANRIQLLLAELERFHLDLIVFPRFSLPFQFAPVLRDWADSHSCNIAVGGHSLPLISGDIEAYVASMSLRLPDAIHDRLASAGLVIDAVLRHGRSSQYSLSQLDSPFGKKEQVHKSPQSCELFCASGRVNTVLIGSRDLLDSYLSSKAAPPELLVISSNVHASDIYDLLRRRDHLKHLPVVATTSSVNVAPDTFIAPPSDNRPLSQDGWEGVEIVRIEYERSGTGGLSAQITSRETVPVVYVKSETGSGNGRSFWGYATSVRQAQGLLDSKSADQPIVLCCSSAQEFFCARAAHADQSIRQMLLSLPASEIPAVGKALESIKHAADQRFTMHVTPAPVTPELQGGARTPVFVNRSKDLQVIARFVDRTDGSRMLLLHGPQGVGKRALVAEAQKTDEDRHHWLHFRCIPDATLGETLSQLLVAAGREVKEPISLDSDSYDVVIGQLVVRGYRVLVMRDAHNLPLGADDPEHASLIAFMSRIGTYSSTPAPPPVLLISEWPGHLSFSGSHLLRQHSVKALSCDDMTTLLRELVAARPCKYGTPLADQLEAIAAKLHGYPILAEIAAGLLERQTASEVIANLHKSREVRHFVLTSLLQRVHLSRVEREFLCLAATFRVPVDASVFDTVAGAQSRRIVRELVDRLLLGQEGRRVTLHPLLRDHFRHTELEADATAYHRIAYQYFDDYLRCGDNSIDVRLERMFHGVSAGQVLSADDVRLLAGPIRTAMFEAMRNKEWESVERTARQVESINPSDSVTRVALAVALDARGNAAEAEQYADSVLKLDWRYVWLGIEYARSKIRRRDFATAERVLKELEARHGGDARVNLAWAQYLDVTGNPDEARERCELVLRERRCHPRDAFQAGLILRHLSDLQPLIRYVETNYPGDLPNNDGLRRLYAYACVDTGHAPNDGLSILSEMWQASGKDGRVVADYGAALGKLGRTKDAEEVFEAGLQECDSRKQDLGFVLEAYSQFLSERGMFTRAHSLFRKVIRMRRHELFLQRRFAKSLTEAARTYAQVGDHATEDACQEEARQVLLKILEVAPYDKWAAGQIEGVDNRAYSGD